MERNLIPALLSQNTFLGMDDRTMNKGRRCGRFAILLVAILITVMSAPFALWAESAASASDGDVDYMREPDITAPAAILIDAVSGQVLYEKDADTPMEPASLTKILTTLLAIENMKPNDTVVVGDKAVAAISKGANIALKKGEELTVKDLIYAMMLSSANDAAVAVAEAIDGSAKKFAKRMNEKATELGAEDSNFVNPNGFSNDNHFTTARDMSIITQAAMKNEAFRDYAKTLDYTIPETNKSDERKLENGNLLFSGSDTISVYKHKRQIKFDEATGVKIGFTESAKYCISASAKRGGIELIAVVLGAGRNLHYTDAEELFEYGFHNFEMIKVVKKGESVAEVTVENGREDSVKAISNSDVSALMPVSGDKQNLKIDVKAEESVNAPVKKGDDLGSSTVYYKEVKIGEVKLIAADDIKATSIKKIFKDAGRVMSLVIKIIIGIIAIFALWLIYSVISSATRRRAKKNVKNFYGTSGYTSREVKRIRRLK
jgi:D-alanyl-D-alanine carboxypeptidase (penicillin-binding protein 5/6)